MLHFRKPSFSNPEAKKNFAKPCLFAGSENFHRKVKIYQPFCHHFVSQAVKNVLKSGQAIFNSCATKSFEKNQLTEIIIEYCGADTRLTFLWSVSHVSDNPVPLARSLTAHQLGFTSILAYNFAQLRLAFFYREISKIFNTPVFLDHTKAVVELSMHEWKHIQRSPKLRERRVEEKNKSAPYVNKTDHPIITNYSNFALRYPNVHLFSSPLIKKIIFDLQYDYKY